MIIELPIGKSRYKITCNESEQEKLFQLAEKLNHRVNNLSLSLKNADEKILLVISALMMEEELENSQDSGDEDKNPKVNDQDIYDAVSDNMENICNYIEKLISKIQNY